MEESFVKLGAIYFERNNIGTIFTIQVFASTTQALFVYNPVLSINCVLSATPSSPTSFPIAQQYSLIAPLTWYSHN